MRNQFGQFREAVVHQVVPFSRKDEMSVFHKRGFYVGTKIGAAGCLGNAINQKSRSLFMKDCFYRDGFAFSEWRIFGS